MQPYDILVVGLLLRNKEPPHELVRDERRREKNNAVWFALV